MGSNILDDPDPEGIPKERDRVTGEAGDLGVWDDELGTAPLEVWDGIRAVFAYFGHAHLGDQFEAGDQMAVVFTDRALICTVDEVETGDEDGA